MGGGKHKRFNPNEPELSNRTNPNCVKGFSILSILPLKTCGAFFNLNDITNRSKCPLEQLKVVH